MRSIGDFAKRHWGLTLLLALLLAMPAGYALAQGNVLLYGSSAMGTFSAQNPVLVYSFQGNAGDQVMVYAVGISPQLSPSLSLLGPTQQQLAANARDPFGSPAGGAARVSYRLPAVGVYTVIVSSPSGAQGDFLLRLDGIASSASTALALNAPATVNILPGAAPIAYSFNGDPANPQTLTLSTETLNFGFTAQVYDGNGQLIAVLAGQTLRSASLTVIGEGLYQVVVAGLLPEQQGSVQAALTSGGVATAAVPTSVPGGTSQCRISNPAGGNVNIRSGPGTNYPAIGSLNVGATMDAVGRDSTGSWYVVNVGGRQGWIAASVVTLEGACLSLPVVPAPPTPIIPPTSAATVTQPASQPSFTPSPTLPGPTATWTPTLPGPTATFTPTATATATTPPAPVATLNFSLPPNYGSVALTSGFVPDPYQTNITSGGPVDVSYLGGGCVGFATSAPDFSVNYTSGAFPTLRFYFIGNGDTAMVVNTPGGSYVCVDDSFGTLNPTIDFQSPASGRYDIWIASFAQGTFIGGTLYVTENTGNHP